MTKEEEKTMEKYRGVAVPEEIQSDRIEPKDPVKLAWMRGVDEARRAARSEPAPADLLRDEGDIPAVEAFVLIVEDSPDSARDIVRDMSRRDRAVLSFYARRLLEITDNEDTLSMVQDNRRARLSFEGQSVPGSDDPPVQL